MARREVDHLVDKSGPMKRLGEVARVSRGVVTGNSALFIMTRDQAKGRGIEAFTKPVLGGSRAFPKNGPPVIRDNLMNDVVIVASRRDVDDYPKLKDYLGDAASPASTPRISAWACAIS